MSVYIKYTLIVKVYGKQGVNVVDYFETCNYHKALETFDDMLTEARFNNYGFAGMCDVIFTKTMYNSDGKATGSDQFKVHVHGEEADI